MDEQQLTSGLPPFEKVREENTMRIITVRTKAYSSRFVETTMMYAKEGMERIPVQAELITISDPRVKGFMPSKVWCHDIAGTLTSIEWAILFYVNTTMPQAVRPFKDATHLLYFFPHVDHEVEYDVNVRLFMDQVYVPGPVHKQMAYVVMFGNEAYEQLIIEPNTKDK